MAVRQCYYHSNGLRETNSPLLYSDFTEQRSPSFAFPFRSDHRLEFSAPIPQGFIKRQVGLSVPKHPCQADSIPNLEVPWITFP